MICCVISGMLAACAAPQQPVQTIVIQQFAGDEAEQSSGWLGVRIEVPGPALSEHLRLEGTGLVIVNLVNDGPADRGGVTRYDVIRTVDGQRIKSDFESFATLVKAFEPGRRVELEIVRHGQTKPLTIELGEWPESMELDWQFEDPAIEVSSNDFAVTGKVALRGPDGEWFFEDLGAVEPGELGALLPETHTRTIELWAEDGRFRKRSRVQKNDMCFELEEIEGGQICIRRLTEADRQEDIYPNVDALRDGDREAYEIYVQLQDNHEWGGTSPDEELRRERLEELRAAFGQGLRETEALRLQARRDIEEATAQLREAEARLQRLGGAEGRQAEATYAFTAEDDGSITVTIRKGDTELTKKYAGIDALRQENPTLHERYLALQPSE